MQIFSQQCVLVWIPKMITLGWGPFHLGWPAPPSSPALYSFWKSACFTLHLLNLEFSSLTSPFFIFLQDFMKIFSNLFTWYFQYFSFSCLTFLFHSLCLLCLSFPEYHFQFSSLSTAVFPLIFLLFWCPSSLLKASILALKREDTWQQAADTSRGSCQVQRQLTVQWDLCLPSWASLLSREAFCSLPSSLLGDRPGLPPASNCHT